MKILSIVILSIVGLILLCMIAYLIIGSVCFKIALSRKSTAKRIVNKTMAKSLQNYKIDLCWWDKFEFETLTLITKKDGLKLVGHYFSGGNQKLAIIVHGYGADYREMQKYAKYFLEKNYDILAVENRAHGNSEGKMMGMGWLDRLDLLQWIDLMIEKNPNYKIVLMGLSIGASTVCMASGENLPSNVKAIISDCGYANAYEEFKYVFKSKAHLPAWPILNVFNMYLKSAYKFDLKQADATAQLKKCKLPVLFIHGDSDKFVPVENVYKLSSAISEDKRQVYIAPGADHAMSYPIDEMAYEMELKKFLNKYLKNK